MTFHGNFAWCATGQEGSIDWFVEAGEVLLSHEVNGDEFLPWRPFGDEHRWHYQSGGMALGGSFLAQNRDYNINRETMLENGWRLRWGAQLVEFVEFREKKEESILAGRLETAREI